MDCIYYPNEDVTYYDEIGVYPGGYYDDYLLSNIGSLMSQNITINSLNSYQAAMLSKKLRFISFPYDGSAINILTGSDPVALNQSAGNNPLFFDIGILSAG
jgi:hypothetical protein